MPDRSIPRARRALQLVAALVCLAAASVAAAPSAPIRVDLRARAIRPGELIVLTIATPAAADDVTVRAFGGDTRAFRLSDRSWGALVGVDLDQAPGSYPLVVEAREPDGMERATRTVTVRQRAFPVRRLTVDPDFVNPPPDVAARIGREAAFVREIYAHTAPDRLWRPPFIRPVPGPSNSRFGTRSIFNGEPRSAHGGADFLSPAGTPVRAPNAGRVVAARALFFTGNTVIIDHGLGLYSMLAHLSRIDVREGSTVSAGQVIGLVGATGRVTGPHLHWSLRVGGARVDPLGALALLRRPLAPDAARPRRGRRATTSSRYGGAGAEIATLMNGRG